MPAADAVLEILWVAGGAALSLLIAAALVYWAIQEGRAHPASPPAPAQ